MGGLHGNGNNNLNLNSHNQSPCGHVLNTKVRRLLKCYYSLILNNSRPTLLRPTGPVQVNSLVGSELQKQDPDIELDMSAETWHS